MKKILLVIILTLNTSCYGYYINLDFGVDVWNYNCPVSEEVMNQGLHILHDYLVVHRVYTSQEVQRGLKDIELEWSTDMGIRPSTGELDTVCIFLEQNYSGYYIPESKSICVAWRGSLAQSAFAHELLHGIAYVIEKDPLLGDYGWIYGKEDIYEKYNKDIKLIYRMNGL